MNTIPCNTSGCFNKTKEPYKLCFTCNQKDKVDCRECGKPTSKKYPTCFICSLKNKHKCQSCDKMTDIKYLKCYTCNQKKLISKNIDIYSDDNNLNPTKL